MTRVNECLSLLRICVNVNLTNVYNEFRRLTWKSLAEDFDGRGSFCVTNFLIPLFERIGLEALPG